MHDSICFINCYFGPLPTWFDYFLQSCEFNPTVNWLIYADSSPPLSLPKNVKFINGSLADLSAIASQCVAAPVSLQSGGKVCDLRPAFGEIFSEHLQGFEFWGMTDIDLIYGNLRNFLPIEVTQQFDIISAEERHLAGHFTLFRNCDFINSLYKEAPFLQVWNDARNYCFDETNGVFERSVDGRWNRVIKSIKRGLGRQLNRCARKLRLSKPCIVYPSVTSMTEIALKNAHMGKLRLLMSPWCRSDVKGCSMDWRGRFHGTLNVDWRFEWSNGQLQDLRSHDEVLYFHFQASKKYHEFQSVPPLDDNASFTISETGFQLTSKHPGTWENLD